MDTPGYFFFWLTKFVNIYMHLQLLIRLLLNIYCTIFEAPSRLDLVFRSPHPVFLVHFQMLIGRVVLMIEGLQEVLLFSLGPI
jgi:hypothetical protein